MEKGKSENDAVHCRTAYGTLGNTWRFMRLFSIPAATIVLISCAGASHAPASPTPLTSIDTAYYAVSGNTRREWTANLPRAAAAAGIPSGAPAYTLGAMTWTFDRTRTTSIGCQVEGSRLQLRLGHVMPKLTPEAAPSAQDRASWDAFVASLWQRAHLREEVGARVADSLRADLRRARTADCAQLIARTREQVAAFPAHYMAAAQAAEASLPMMEP